MTYRKIGNWCLLIYLSVIGPSDTIIVPSSVITYMNCRYRTHWLMKDVYQTWLSNLVKEHVEFVLFSQSINFHLTSPCFSIWHIFAIVFYRSLGFFVFRISSYKRLKILWIFLNIVNCITSVHCLSTLFSIKLISNWSK